MILLPVCGTNFEQTRVNRIAKHLKAEASEAELKQGAQNLYKSMVMCSLINVNVMRYCRNFIIFIKCLFERCLHIFLFYKNSTFQEHKIFLGIITVGLLLYEMVMHLFSSERIYSRYLRNTMAVFREYSCRFTSYVLPCYGWQFV